jgi:hypothetical protein
MYKRGVAPNRLFKLNPRLGMKRPKFSRNAQKKSRIQTFGRRQQMNSRISTMS